MWETQHCIEFNNLELRLSTALYKDVNTIKAALQTIVVVDGVYEDLQHLDSRVRIAPRSLWAMTARD